MKTFITCLSLCLFALSGCTSLLSHVYTKPIEQDENARSWGGWLDDHSIETVVGINILKSAKGFKTSFIEVTSYKGNVLLTGRVNNPVLKKRATVVARKVNKVKQVYNELGCDLPRTFLARSNDSWLSLKIKTKMLMTISFPDSKVKLTTYKGAVYLMGTVTAKEARMAVDIVKSTGGVQRVVKIFEYVS